MPAPDFTITSTLSHSPPSPYSECVERVTDSKLLLNVLAWVRVCLMSSCDCDTCWIMTMTMQVSMLYTLHISLQ